jgi:hypothetical protein
MKLLWGHGFETRMMCFCIYEVFLLLKLENFLCYIFYFGCLVGILKEINKMELGLQISMENTLRASIWILIASKMSLSLIYDFGTKIR